MVSYIEERESVIKGVSLYEQTYFIRWIRLKITVFDIQDLVEESADMETEAVLLLIGKNVGVLVIKDPSALREGELELVAVICRFVRRNDRGYLRYIEMPYAYKLVVNLLCFA